MNIIVAVLILGIIVIIHEMGHFLLAKKNGITVTEFSVGMGPRIASFVRNGTRYSLKLFPFGGSCMMLGEDETVDNDEGAFHKKGPWARFSVIFAGAFFNFVFAFILALIYLGNSGVDKPYVNFVKNGSPADNQLSKDDYVTEINGTPIHFGRDIYYYFYFNPISEKPIDITFLRDGKENTTTLTPVWKDTYLFGCDYTEEGDTAKLETVAEDYPLADAGLQEGDIIVNINGTEIITGRDLEQYLIQNPLTDKVVELTYVKASNPTDRITASITPKFVGSGYFMGWDFNLRSEKVSALEVIKYSFYELKLNIVNTLKSVVYLVTGKVSVKEIAGPVGIVNYVGDIVTESKDYGIRATLLQLVQFSILISANLGVMNLLPLPALDGGRLVFILIEAIRRKPVPKEKEAMVHMVGMVLLMMLMVFVLFNDIRNIFM